MLSIGWSKFALERHTQIESGNSYFEISKEEILHRIRCNWDNRKAGDGETGLDRKVLVEVEPDGFFCPPRAKFEPGMKVHSEVVSRCEGEEPYIETFITPDTAAVYGANIVQPASFVEIVVYSAEALQENNGKMTTDCDWEIVCVLAQQGDSTEPMAPLVMARNFLEMEGGTKSDYTAQEFAEAIWHHAKRDIRVRPVRQ